MMQSKGVGIIFQKIESNTTCSNFWNLLITCTETVFFIETLSLKISCSVMT